MRVSQRTVNVGLVVLALAVLAAVVITSGRVTTSEKEARASNVLSAWRDDELTRIEIDRKGKKLVLERSGPNDAGEVSWNILEPFKAEADDFAVDKLTGSLEFATVVRRIKPEEVQRGPFGIDAPEWVMHLDMGELEYRLALGKESPSPAGSRYLEVSGENIANSGVVIISRELAAELDVTASTLRGRNIIPYLSSQLSGLVLEGEGGQRKLEQNELGWKFSGGFRIDRDAFNRILVQFTHTEADHFLPTAEARSALKGQAAVRIIMRPEDKQLPEGVVVVGGKCPKSDNDTVALREKPDPIAGCVPKSVLSALSMSAGELTDKHLFRLRTDEVESLHITRGDQKLVLDRRESGFAMSAPLKAEVELETGNQRLESMLALNGELIDTPDLAALGLKPPAGEVRLKSATESDTKVTEERVEIGKPSADGSIHARRLQDGAVLKLSREAARLLMPDATLVRSRKIFQFESADIKRIEIRGSGADQVLVQNENKSFTLVKPDKLEVDSNLAADISDALSSLTADRWVADADDGSYGLDSPLVSVKIDVGGGDGGVRHDGIKVGAPTSGGSFASLLGEKGVFVLPKHVLSVLTTLAVDRSYFVVEPGAQQSIELSSEGKKLLLSREGQGFVSKDADVSAARVQQILDALAAMRSEAALHSGGALPAEGFDKPQLSVTATPAGEGKPTRFKIGAGDSWRGTSVFYARAEGVDATFVIAQSKVRQLLNAL